jgi:phage FluMu protein Com
MGSIVEFNCQGCGFTTGDLRVGWGRAGRTRFWGGLGVCATCKRLSVVDLAAKLDTHRCQECQGQLQLLEGMAQDIPCPECSRVLRTTNLESGTSASSSNRSRGRAIDLLEGDRQLRDELVGLFRNRSRETARDDPSRDRQLGRLVNSSAGIVRFHVGGDVPSGALVGGSALQEEHGA